MHKSERTTVDGRTPTPSGMYKNPMDTGISTTSTGAEFLNHQQYGTIDTIPSCVQYLEVQPADLCHKKSLQATKEIPGESNHPSPR